MYIKLLWIFVVIVLATNVGRAEAFFEYCDHSYNLDAYGKAFINSPYYSTSYQPNTCQYPQRLPCRYPSGSSCRYQIIVPDDFNVYVQCNISLDNAGSSSCSSEYFYVSTDGDKQLRSSEYFCGVGQFERQSLFGELTLAYTSTSEYNNGWFTCYVEAVPSNLQPGCDCGWSITSKITGGVQTKINEFPAMAAIVHMSDTKSPTCGGAIIHHYWTLSAAHCFDRYRSSDGGNWNPQVLRLLVGEHDLTSTTESPFTELYTVRDVIIHNSYSTSGTDYDIALIKTFQSMRWSRGVGPICLPFKWAGTNFVSSNVDLVGWGTTSFAGARSDVLQKAVVSVVQASECTSTYGTAYADSRQICTRGNNKDSCQYDSGGPAIWRNGRQFLLGVISFGKPCGTNQPAVNTRVTSYLNWIEYYTKENFCKVYN